MGEEPVAYGRERGIAPDTDSFTLEIGAVPEPASLPLLVMGLAGLGMAVVRRRRS